VTPPIEDDTRNVASTIEPLLGGGNRSSSGSQQRSESRDE